MAADSLPDTEFFFSLSPERILESVERAGFYCTGRVLALNSMENRVYEVEIETGDVRVPSDRFKIAKFYRPGRWSGKQILEEHDFLGELAGAEIPVVAPLHFSDGSTLGVVAGTGIFYALFPKRGGRSPDELLADDFAQLGRLIGRVHTVGGAKNAQHRLRLDCESYALSPSRYLCEAGFIPQAMRQAWVETVNRICEITQPWLDETAYQRIHGDCHLGNLIRNAQGLTLVDFDDFVTGPCVQDLWLFMPGTGEEDRRRWETLLDGYGQMRRFDKRELRLIEPLRALRYVRYCAWIAKRWNDPAFPRYFPAFGTDSFWREKLEDLIEQRDRIEVTVWG
jgi:Ser/Thr protein kinase RdoA (MazF antagonist)